MRQSRVAAKEAGGITQSIGAYQVQFGERRITFIDTPGHAAFSKMRERGATVADVAVLVVAADDGVKPQTNEAIAHAKAAQVPMVAALNKMDIAPKEALTKIKGQLAKEGVIPEDQGGDVPVVPVSAKTGEGVDKLLEMIGLVADLLELKSNPAGKLSAVVIESSLNPQQGPLATVVVKEGTLKTGEEISAGEISGKVKALVNSAGKRVPQAGPGDPVQVLGFSDVPPVGSTVSDQPAAFAPPPAAAPTVPPTAAADEGLNLILRADTEGSLEALVQALDALDVGGKKVNLLLKGVGAVGDSDVRLAAASNGLILGFNVAVPAAVKSMADDHGVGVRTFAIIYELLDMVEKLLEGAKIIEEEAKSPEAQVVSVFKLHSGDLVAGVKVLNGKIKYRDRISVLREEEEIHQGRVRGLKVGQDEVSEVKAGQEAGILIKPQFEVQKGDRLVVNFRGDGKEKDN
ncbi:MAG: GTP-binding protein [bacterium]|nr:GTP-binding protein [bacterium]